MNEPRATNPSIILAVGDLHGKTDALFRLLDWEQPDGLVCVGDWGDAGAISLETWAAILARVPVLTVFGNHDDLDLLPTLRNSDGSTVLVESGARRDFCGLTVGGASGIWAKSDRKPYYVTDTQVAAFAARLAGGGDAAPVLPRLDLLLTHGCPIGVADQTASGRRGGQRCFLDLLKTVQPTIYLCGHLHVAQRHDLSLSGTATATPCAVLNTGSLPDGGNYVRLTRQRESSSVWTAGAQVL